MSRVKRYVLTGLLVWIPLLVTVIVVRFLIEVIDRSFLLLPTKYQPEQLLGVHIPGLGVLLAITIVIITGMLAANVIGSYLVKMWEALLQRIPFVRTLYGAVKQVMQTLLTPGDESFRRVLLVEYPRRGLWSIAFQTGNGFRQAQETTQEDMLTIFIPTTPNPTSGFLMVIPKRDAVVLDMGIDEALKFVISLGVVVPNGHALKEEKQSC